MESDHPVGNWVSQLRKGVVELAVLNLLAQGESYGYELTRRCAKIPGLEMKEATLYQVLSRLCDAGLLRTRQERTTRLRKRTYYTLTAAGRRRLEAMNAHFDGVVEQILRLRDDGESE